MNLHPETVKAINAMVAEQQATIAMLVGRLKEVYIAQLHPRSWLSLEILKAIHAVEPDWQPPKGARS